MSNPPDEPERASVATNLVGISEERFRSYFKTRLDRHGDHLAHQNILEVNDEICGLLGHERDELLRKTWAELTHPDDLRTDLAQFNRVIAGEIEGYSIDKRWIRKDGQVIDATVSVKALRRADGSVNYFVALLQDISERKWAEEELRNQNVARPDRLESGGRGHLRLEIR
jgi:PAS domain S-box-containing protein